MVSTRLILAVDLASTIAQAGVDPTLEGRALQDALLSAIADRRGYLSWDVDHAVWLVFPHHPKVQTFHGRTLEEALARCLVWLMALEMDIDQSLMEMPVSGVLPETGIVHLILVAALQLGTQST